MTKYIVAIEEQIQNILQKYDNQRNQNDNEINIHRQLSEFNPLITPLKIDKAFQSFQNSHRLTLPSSKNNNQSMVLNQNSLQLQQEDEIEKHENNIKRLRIETEISISDASQSAIISDSPLIKKELDEDLKRLLLDNTNIEVNQSISQDKQDDSLKNKQFAMKDLDLSQDYFENEQEQSNEEKSNQQINQEDFQRNESKDKINIQIQSKKLNEVEVSTSKNQISQNQKKSVIKENKINLTKSKSTLYQADNKENKKIESNLQNQQKRGATISTINQNKEQSKENNHKKSLAQPQTSSRTNSFNGRNSIVDKPKNSKPNLNNKAKQETKQGNKTNLLNRREESRDKSQNQPASRKTSVPRLHLQSLQNENNQQKETHQLFGFNIINKNLVEVDNPNNHVLSGLLSPIDLKESNRDIASKLDQLYKSYETKEMRHNNQQNSLMKQIDDEVLLDESMTENQDYEQEFIKETPLRKRMEEKNNNKKRKYNKISNDEEEKHQKVEMEIKQQNTKKLKKNDYKQDLNDEEQKGSNNKMKRLILWFRNDLRLHDNVVLNYTVNAQAKQKEVVPVFCFDPRFFGSKVEKYQTLKCGLVRQRFILESVENFRERLEKVGSHLLVSIEKPEEYLSTLIDDDFENTIVFQEEICSEELTVEKAVKEVCKKRGAHVETLWGSTVYHRDDLGFHPSDLPHIYGKFREKTQGVKVRPLFAQPKSGQLSFIEKPTKEILKHTKFIPKLEDFGFSKEEISQPKSKNACYDFKGGEDAAVKRLNEYIFDVKAVGSYAITRNDLIGANYSSKFSPWLACGALSPKYIYFQVKEFENKHRNNESTKIFLDELFWRDFYRFWAMKYGNKIFSSYGIYNREYYNWATNMDIVNRWRDGKTGMPLIDALMREMNATGFMPNRGRMVVACYLAMDLKQDWRYGAYHFEEKLIDHDVQSNYGGWCFSAGIGPGRVLIFNTVKQSKDHDKYGEYIKMWVPELKNVPIEYIHEPWTMPKDLQKGCKTIIGEIYPLPIPCHKYTDKVVFQQEKSVKKAKKEKDNLKQTKLK